MSVLRYIIIIISCLKPSLEKLFSWSSLEIMWLYLVLKKYKVMVSYLEGSVSSRRINSEGRVAGDYPPPQIFRWRG